MRYLRDLFYRTSAGDWFCSTAKYFTNKLEKTHWKENKIGECWYEKQQLTQKLT